MSKNRKLLITIAGICILIMVLTPASLASVNSSVETLIRIAFMNGYVEALSTDLETFRELKKDRQMLKETVEDSVEKYIDRVRRMND